MAKPIIPNATKETLKDLNIPDMTNCFSFVLGSLSDLTVVRLVAMSIPLDVVDAYTTVKTQIQQSTVRRYHIVLSITGWAGIVGISLLLIQQI